MGIFLTLFILKSIFVAFVVGLAILSKTHKNDFDSFGYLLFMYIMFFVFLILPISSVIQKQDGLKLISRNEYMQRTFYDAIYTNEQ